MRLVLRVCGRSRRSFVQERRFRDSGPSFVLGKSLPLSGLRFPCLDLELITLPREAAVRIM